MSDDKLSKPAEADGNNKSSHPIVLLVDDQTIVAEAIRRMLIDETDKEKYGETWKYLRDLSYNISKMSNTVINTQDRKSVV